LGEEALQWLCEIMGILQLIEKRQVYKAYKAVKSDRKAAGDSSSEWRQRAPAAESSFPNSFRRRTDLFKRQPVEIGFAVDVDASEAPRQRLDASDDLHHVSYF
jgi:hypothetical protein